MQSFKNVIDRIRRKPKPEIVQIQTSDDGLEAIWEDGRTEAMRWSEVDRVFTYKVDCFAYDMIWLAFEHGQEKRSTFGKRRKGFRISMSALNKAFPELNAEWYDNVMQPAFAENLTVLFERKGEAEQSLAVDGAIAGCQVVS